MAPALEMGDVVITRLVRPPAVRRGDIVTFRDPTREGELVTHRVVDVQREGNRFSFLTRGDTNTGEERWSVDADGTIGAMAFRVPYAGYVLAWLRMPMVRTAFLVGAALLFAAVALRRIWSAPPFDTGKGGGWNAYGFAAMAPAEKPRGLGAETFVWGARG